MADRGPEFVDEVEHYRRVELMADVGSWRWQPELERLWWSPGMHRIFGITPEDFDGRMQSLFDAVLPEDRHLLVEAARRFEATGEPELLKYRIERPDGAVRHVLANGQTITDSQGRTVAFGYVVDVTDRVRAESRLESERDRVAEEGEERFRAMVIGAPMPAILHAEDGEVLLVNQRFTELTGYEPDEVPTIRAWTDKAYRARAEEVRAGIQRLFALRDATDEGEFELRAKDGTRRAWLFSSAPAGRLADGRSVVMSMARDVTAERALEEERRQSEQRFHREQRVASLGELAGGIAHDFNNILMGILGNVGVATDLAAGDAALRRLLEEIQEAAERAAGLSRDMLTYAGRQRPGRSSVRIDAGVSELQSLLRARVPHSHEIRYRLQAGPAAALLAANELGQVVMNLVGNAADALAPGGSITVRTGLERLGRPALAARLLGDAAPESDHVFLEVEDDGAGMDPATVERIFEPFFSTRSSGRGLGMAVVLGVTRAAQGTIEVDSAPGRGTRIRVSFPLAAESAESTEVVGSSAVSPRPRTSGRSILVVDDEAIVRRTLERMLRRLGYDVRTARSGEEAIDVHARLPHPPAAAIVDLTMPTMSGLDVLRALKSRQPDLPVVLTTGYTETGLSDDALDPLRDGFLAKPFKLQQLREKLEGVLREERAEAPE